MNARSSAADAWITVKPNGESGKGAPVEIDKDGYIKKSMGGKFNGQRLDLIPRKAQSAPRQEATPNQPKRQYELRKPWKPEAPKPAAPALSVMSETTPTPDYQKPQPDTGYSGMFKKNGINNPRGLVRSFVESVKDLPEAERVQKTLDKLDEVRGVMMGMVAAHPHMAYGDERGDEADKGAFRELKLLANVEGGLVGELPKSAREARASKPWYADQVIEGDTPDAKQSRREWGETNAKQFFDQVNSQPLSAEQKAEKLERKMNETKAVSEAMFTLTSAARGSVEAERAMSEYAQLTAFREALLKRGTQELNKGYAAPTPTQAPTAAPSREEQRSILAKRADEHSDLGISGTETMKTHEAYKRAKDSGAMSFDASPSKRRVDDNGYMHVDACCITKAQVAPYYGREIPGFEELKLEPDKIYYMLRPADELEKAAASFNGVPLAFEHHVMSAENMPKEFIVGSLGTEAAFSAPYVINSLVITDKEAIESIERGDYKELSAAYRYKPVMKAGTFEGEKYDGRMTDISANHVALVKEGRAGPDVVVRDSRTTPKIYKKERVFNMRKNVSSVMRRAIAFDAVPEIEGAEVNAAALLLAINAVEAQREGLDPRAIGLDVDKGATIDQIVERFFPETPEADLVTIKSLLEKLQGAPVVEKEADDAEISEAMKNCGVDAEDPAASKAFAAGVKYGEGLEKTEPKKLDAEHEAEGMKKVEDAEGIAEGVKIGEKLEKEEPKKLDAEHEAEGMRAAMDAQIKRAKDEAKSETLNHMKALQQAARDCAALTGSGLDPFAYDSADDIYKKALELSGVKTAGFPAAAYRGMVSVLKSQRPAPVIADANSFAAARDSKEVEASLKGLDSINIL